MEVRAKKALGQHFLTDQRIAQAIVDALQIPGQAGNDENGVMAGTTDQRIAQAIVDALQIPGQAGNDGNGVMAGSTGHLTDVMAGPTEHLTGVMAGLTGHLRDVLEVGPGMGVLTQYLLQREDIDLKLVEIDGESVDYLLTHFPGMQGRLLQADFLNLRLEKIFPERFAVIGNFPYNISSQIFFKILDYRERIPEVVCMIQKEVAERIAEGPGSKTYGILSVLLQAWYDIEYLFSVGSGCFAPPPKVESAVIRLTRNSRTDLGCDESLFKAVVKTAFGQRRKMMRNPLKPLIAAKAAREGWSDEEKAAFTANPVFERRPETLSVEDFIDLTNLLT